MLLTLNNRLIGLTFAVSSLFIAAIHAEADTEHSNGSLDDSAQAAAADPSESTTSATEWAAESTTTTNFWAAESTDSEESTAVWWTPSETTSATSTGTTTASADGVCGAAYAQCGGLDYTGETCCQNGYECITANSYWARCVAASTLASEARTASGSLSPSSLRSSSSSSGKGTTSTIYTTYDTIFASSVQISGSTYSTAVSTRVTSAVTIVKENSSIRTISSTNGVSGSPSNMYAAISSWKSKALVASVIGFSAMLAGL